MANYIKTKMVTKVELKEAMSQIRAEFKEETSRINKKINSMDATLKILLICQGVLFSKTIG